MTLGLDVFVQDVMAAMSTSPWPTSTRPVGSGVRSERSGVGRLLAISASVHTLVSRASAPLTLGGIWLPPPGTTARPRVAVKRSERADAGFPYPFSAIGFEKRSR